MSNQEELVIIEIEEFAISGREVPKHHPHIEYRFKVGNTVCKSREPHITGSQILEKASLTPPENYQLNQKFRHGAMEVIALNQVVDLSKPGLERFTYIKRDPQEG